VAMANLTFARSSVLGVAAQSRGRLSDFSQTFQTPSDSNIVTTRLHSRCEAYAAPRTPSGVPMIRWRNRSRPGWESGLASNSGLFASPGWADDNRYGKHDMRVSSKETNGLGTQNLAPPRHSAVRSGHE
jgi:hypothetical protein